MGNAFHGAGFRGLPWGGGTRPGFIFLLFFLYSSYSKIPSFTFFLLFKEISFPFF